MTPNAISKIQKSNQEKILKHISLSIISHFMLFLSVLSFLIPIYFIEEDGFKLNIILFDDLNSNYSSKKIESLMIARSLYVLILSFCIWILISFILNFVMMIFTRKIIVKISRQFGILNV